MPKAESKELQTDPQECEPGKRFKGKCNRHNNARKIWKLKQRVKGTFKPVNLKGG